MRIVNKKKFIKATTTLIVGLVLSITMILTLINFCKYPEEYLTTWKYQLKHKIAEGDQILSKGIHRQWKNFMGIKRKEERK